MSPARILPRQGLIGRLAMSTVAMTMCVAVQSGCERDTNDGSRSVRIDFWTLSLRPTFNEYIEGRIAAFEGEHPDVRIEWVDVPFPAMDRKLISASAAGRAPDVINLSDKDFARFAGAGAFVDLNMRLAPGVLARYHDGAASIGRLGGQQLALPWYLTTQARMVNVPLLEAGGLTTDTLAATWSGVLEQAAPFHQRTGSFLISQAIGTDSELLMMMMADGMPPFTSDHDGLLRADLTGPRIVAFVERWVDLFREGHLPRQSATDGFGHLIEIYQNREVAVVNAGANFLGRIRSQAPEVYDATEIMPALTGSLGSPHIAVMTLGVTVQSDHPSEAAAWAAFITSPASQSLFCREASIMPSTPESLEDPYFAGPTARETAEGRAKIGLARRTVAEGLVSARAFTPRLEAWPAMRRAFDEGMKRMLLDGADVSDELASIEQRWNTLIDEMNAERAEIGQPPASLDDVPAPDPAGVSMR